MKDIAKEIIDKTIEETIAKQVEPEDVFNKVIGRLVDKVNEYNAILTELEEWLKEPEYFNGRKLRQDYITVMTTDVLNKIQELKEKYKC